VRRSAVAGAIAVLGMLPAAADVPPPPEVHYENVAYDGRLTFVRLRFNPSVWGPGNYIWGLDLKWNHDYPRADLHLMKILEETTTIDVDTEITNVFALDDPELFRYPVAYLCEVGFWTLSESEAAGLRAYLLKGGFMIVDDFQGAHWFNFVEQLGRVLPEARLVQLEATHPIFDSFFRVDPYEFRHPYAGVPPPSYFGVFEDNDPSRRLMLIANYNHDVGEYWEWSDTDYVPIDLSNEAYKLGVNYIVYGMTR
jgi:Domain of unknown function (DUF4159)